MSNQQPAIKQGRVDGKNSDYKSGSHFVPKFIRNQIELVLQENRDKGAHKDKRVGQGTEDKRETVVRGFFSDLFHLKYRIEDIKNIKEKHLTAVFNYLEDQGQSPATLQNKISVMRVFCGWIGKPGMVKESSVYVKDKISVKRTLVAQKDKSWEGNGVDLLEKLTDIRAKDESVALCLELSLAFGLRVKEALMLRPAAAHEGCFVMLRDGTKGGRSRVIPVENDVQRDLLRRAKEQMDKKTGFIGGQRGKTLQQKYDRFFNVMKSVGITLKDLGVTAHGLRHQYMHESFEEMLGVPAPIKGGDLSLLDKDELHVASQKLMERAGHTRVSIGSAYYGSLKIKRTEVGGG